MKGLLTVIAVFVELRRTPRRFRDRAAFLKWQTRKLSKWLNKAPAKTAYYGPLMSNVSKIEDLPIVDKQILMKNFADFNRTKIDRESGWKAFDTTRMVGDFHVGASTGTSGNRGLYVISDRERYVWLGAMLAKALPDFWRRRERIAVALPLHTRLYDVANKFGPVSLRFFDVTDGPESWIDDLLDFSPTTLIAPPKILRWLVDHDPETLRPIRVFSGAEVLDPIDRKHIEARYDLKLGQIYMATEGLLAVSCAEGQLHLCEDIIHFELEPQPNSDLVSPIITDFRRETQIMARYRMNDLLRISTNTCVCGSPCLVVDEIVGRKDDVFLFNSDGKEIQVTPDVMRNAVLDADRDIQDFRIRQTSADQIELHLGLELSDITASMAAKALTQLLEQRGVNFLNIELVRKDLRLDVTRKLRRVERDIP